MGGADNRVEVEDNNDEGGDERGLERGTEPDEEAEEGGCRVLVKFEAVR